MMQAQTLRDSGIGRAAKTVASGGDLEQAARAIYAAFDPAWHTGRDDSAGEMQLQLRPPTDLRGSSCGMRLSGGRRYRQDYDALPDAACNAPGAGEAWQIRHFSILKYDCQIERR